MSQQINPLEVWRLDTAELIARCSGHRDEVAALAVHCDAGAEDELVCEVVSGGVDKTMRFWDFSGFLVKYLESIEDDASFGEESTQLSDSVSCVSRMDDDQLFAGGASFYSEDMR
jgi:WD40 repeat protein